jgi:hypothetical protein
MEDYLKPGSEPRKLMAGWGLDGFEVISVLNDQRGGVLVTLQKAEPIDDAEDLLRVIRELENPPRTRTTD